MNESPQMILKSSGNLSIGTTTSTHQLVVNSEDTETVRLIGPGGSGSDARLNFGDGDLVYIDEPNEIPSSRSTLRISTSAWFRSPADRGMKPAS